jgi:hypothetical protein
MVLHLTYRATIQELESQVSALMMALEISAKEKTPGAITDPPGLIATKAPIMARNVDPTGSIRQASPLSVVESSSVKQGVSTIARHSNSSSPSSTSRGGAAR